MPEPYKPRRVEVFSKGSKVSEITASNSCNSLIDSIGSETSTFRVDCGRRRWVCPSGWSFYNGYSSCVGGTTNGSCWQYVGNNRGNAGFCGWRNWNVRRPIPKVVLDPQYRHVVTVMESGDPFTEAGRWNSEWFCYFTSEQIAAYNAAKPSTTSYGVQWCPEEGFIQCGNPCSEDGDWCCLDCAKFAAKINQAARAAEAIKRLLY